jgi:hypothetical protein
MIWAFVGLTRCRQVLNHSSTSTSQDAYIATETALTLTDGAEPRSVITLVAACEKVRIDLGYDRTSDDIYI